MYCAVLIARDKTIRIGHSAALNVDPTGQLSYTVPEFGRLWQEISDLDMTVTIHLGGRIPRFGEKQHFLPDMVMSKLALAEPIAILIFNGVFQRFPKLRFVTVESGVGWISFMAEYIDRSEKHTYELP